MKFHVLFRSLYNESIQQGFCFLVMIDKKRTMRFSNRDITEFHYTFEIPIERVSYMR